MKNDNSIYVNFCCNLFANRQPSVVDKYFRENRDSILRVSKLLREKYRPKVGPIYRGILIDERLIIKRDNQLFLRPYKGIEYISFSEKKEVAERFADINSSDSQFIKALYPNHKGYMIEYRPNINEIVQYYQWSILLKCPEMIENFYSGAVELIRDQKEVTIIQNNKEFLLKEY